MRCLLTPLAHRLARGDRGATAVEYSLIVVFIAAVIAAVVMVLGGQVRGEFQAIVSNW